MPSNSISKKIESLYMEAKCISLQLLLKKLGIEGAVLDNHEFEVALSQAAVAIHTHFKSQQKPTFTDTRTPKTAVEQVLLDMSKAAGVEIPGTPLVDWGWEHLLKAINDTKNTKSSVEVLSTFSSLKDLCCGILGLNPKSSVDEVLATLMTVKEVVDDLTDFNCGWAERLKPLDLRLKAVIRDKLANKEKQIRRVQNNSEALHVKEAKKLWETGVRSTETCPYATFHVNGHSFEARIAPVGNTKASDIWSALHKLQDLYLPPDKAFFQMKKPI